MTPETADKAARSVGRLVPDDAGGQHDVAAPAARPAVAHEHAILSGPVLGNETLAAGSERQRRRAPRAVPGRVAAMPLRVQRKPAPVNVGANQGISSSASRGISPGADRGAS